MRTLEIHEQKGTRPRYFKGRNSNVYIKDPNMMNDVKSFCKQYHYSMSTLGVIAIEEKLKREILYNNVQK